MILLLTRLLARGLVRGLSTGSVVLSRFFKLEFSTGLYSDS